MCDASLAYRDRAVDLVARLSLDEKLGRSSNGSVTSSTPLSNYASALPSVGVGYYQWWSEALHGVASSPGIDFDAAGFKSATSFPQVIATSMSFNRSLYRAVGRVVATEARAFSNKGHAGLTFWTPNLNLFRDPRWGRGQETAGECPFLTSEYVQQLVPGLQQDPERDPDGNFIKVSACCKHYAGYSLEQWDGVSRHEFDAIIGEQDFADTYLPAFEACASPSRGAASSMMCSYNAVNGVPSCANEWLLSDLARSEWGFEGCEINGAAILTSKIRHPLLLTALASFACLLACLLPTRHYIGLWRGRGRLADAQVCRYTHGGHCGRVSRWDRSRLRQFLRRAPGRGVRFWRRD